MDLQQIVDGFRPSTCVVSVEQKSDGSCGVIRIVAGNQAYYDTFRLQGTGNYPKMLTDTFIPGAPYDTLVPKDLNFERYCFRCAIEGKPLHSYVNLPNLGCWVNIMMLPLQSDTPRIGYCTYTVETSMTPDSALMSNLSYESANDVLRTCIKLRGTDDFKTTVAEVIEDIRSICDAERCCIKLLDHENQTSTLLCEATRKNSLLEPADIREGDISYELMLSWDETLAGSSCLIIKDWHDMELLREKNQEWYESLTGKGVQSLVLFPLRYDGKTLGYIWALDFDTPDTVRIKETLELTAFFLASEIANYQLVERLQVLCSMDLLTGVNNRNEMNTCVDALKNEGALKEEWGVIFADLNGLKRVNDTDGHFEGDEVLRKAASALQEIFGDTQRIFRAGGDEFMILTKDLTKPQMDACVEKIRAYDGLPGGCSFAAGCCLAPVGGDIRDAMHTADVLMYEDKERHYAEFPEERYR